MVALITVVSLLFVASEAAALTLAGSIEGLAKRQSASGIDPSDFPSACQSGCTSVLNTIEACTDVSCVCTSSNLNSIQSCINCIVNTDPSATLQSAGQSVLNTYNSECAGQGVGSLTLGSATGTGSSSPSSTGSSSSGIIKKGAAGKVSISVMGAVGAGVVGGIVALL